MYKSLDFAILDSVKRKELFVLCLLFVFILNTTQTKSFGFEFSERNANSLALVHVSGSSTVKSTKYLPLSKCKLRESKNTNSAFNIFRPRIDNLDFYSPIKALIFFVDFSDQKSNTLHSSNFESVTSQISKYYRSISNGLIRFKWTQEKSIARMPKSLIEYGAGARSLSIQSVQIILDAQKVAFKDSPNRNFDYFIVVSPPEISHSQLSTSLSLLQSDSELINSTILANDFWSSGKPWTILAHEIGHAMGLLDLYSYQVANNVSQHPSLFLRQFQYMRFYDLMNWPTGPAPEISAWNRWELGILKNEQVRCLPHSNTETTLEALESQDDGIKALFLKITEFQIIVVENRQAIGFDRALPSAATGIIIYMVNLRENSGYGQQQLIYSNSLKESVNMIPLALHEIQVVEDLKIKCLNYFNFHARVLVTKF